MMITNIQVYSKVLDWLLKIKYLSIWSDWCTVVSDDDGSEGYLVDFQRKAVDRIVEQRRGEQMDRDTGHTSDEEPPNDELISAPANPEEEW